MSGFAYNLKLTTALTPVAVVHNQEAAGKVGKVLGVIAAVVMPFAAPAIWGAIAGSTAIGASIAGGLTGAFGAGAANIIGSAAIGALGSAAASYAGGARGAAVWASAFTGGLGAGLGAAARGVHAAATAGANIGGTAGAGVNAIGGTGPVVLAPTAAAGVQTASSGGIMGAINNIFSGGGINRIGAAIANALVNGESQDRLDALVAQQQAALQTLNSQEQAAYAQRMQAAQQILADADRQNPERQAYMRMADVMGIMNREHDQALRNIAVRQGGSLDSGQRKAYERSGKLEIGRAKALAWGKGWSDGTLAQNALRAQGAGLMTGPSYAGWQQETELLAAKERAKRESDNSTWGGLTGAFMERNIPQATSPDPSAQNNDNEDGFFGGLTNPFGRG